MEDCVYINRRASLTDIVLFHLGKMVPFTLAQIKSQEFTGHI